MKIVYAFHPDTHLFAGQITLTEDDLSLDGDYLIPSNALEVEPPAAQGGKQLRAVDGAWIQEDIPMPVADVPAYVPPEAPEPIVFDPASFLTMPLPKKEAPKDLQGQLVAAVQTYMDSMAQAYKYDSIASAISYAEEPSVKQFQDEGKLFRAWRSIVWARCYQLLEEVQTGKRSVPDAQQLIALLPLFDAQEKEEGSIDGNE